MVTEVLPGRFGNYPGNYPGTNDLRLLTCDGLIQAQGLFERIEP